MSSSNFPEILSRIAGTLFYILPIFLFVILAIYYVSNVGTKLEGVFVLVGNILILLVAISHQFLYLFIDSWGFELFSFINIGVNAISFVGYLLFLIGFLKIIQQNIKKTTS